MTPDKLLESLQESEKLCPSCGVNNNCMVAAGKSGSACWCFSVEIKEEKTENVNSCYCKRCVKER